MLACKLFLSDRLLAMISPELMKVIERQALHALIAAGANPFRVLWMQEEKSHCLDGYGDGSEQGRFRVYFEVPLQ